MTKLFVYGTLRKGLHNHCYLEHADAVLLQNYHAHGYKLHLFMYDLGSIPIIVKSDNENDYVVGEIYELVITPQINRLEAGYKLRLLEGTEDVYVYYPSAGLTSLPEMQINGNEYDFLAA